MSNSDGEWRCQTSSCGNSKKCVFFNQSDVKFGGREVWCSCSHQGIETSGWYWHVWVNFFYFFHLFLNMQMLCSAPSLFLFYFDDVRECGEDRMPPLLPIKEGKGFSQIFEFLNVFCFQSCRGFLSDMWFMLSEISPIAVQTHFRLLQSVLYLLLFFFFFRLA